MSITCAIFATITLLLVSCSPKGPVQHHDLLRADAEPLRSAFNSDTGRVRAIVLASPT